MEYTVLLADDDEDDLVLLATHVKQCHQKVKLTYAQNGVEAIEKLMNGLQPNLIIIDSQMPLMNGYELLVWLMKSNTWRHVPVVMWTGAIADHEVTRYYRAGANTVLLKQKALVSVEAFCQHWFELVQLPERVSTQHD